jgi:monoamine oxidase
MSGCQRWIFWLVSGVGPEQTQLFSHRVGGSEQGRRTRVDAEGWVDNGGQWIGPGQTHILELAEEMGVETFPAFQNGRHILVFGGERFVYAAEARRYGPSGLTII